MATQPYIDTANAEFQKTIQFLKTEYARLQIGRSNPAFVEDLKVEAYGTQQPLKALASVSCPDAKTIQIQPWDRGISGAIEKAIQTSGLGLNPVNDGKFIRINMPPLTEERRRELVKVVHKMAEEGRISIRQSRQKAHDTFRELEKQKSISEDEARLSEKHLQEKVDHTNKEIEELAKKKEQDIMTI